MKDKRHNWIIYLTLIVTIFLVAIYILSLDKTMFLGSLIAVIAIYYILRPAWITKDYGANRVKRYSLWISMTVAIAGISIGIWDRLVYELLATIFPTFFQKNPFSVFQVSPLWMYGFLIIIILIINWPFNKKNISEPSIDSLIKKKSPNEKYIEFVDYLRAKVEDINDASDWSDENYVELEVLINVEIKETYFDSTNKIAEIGVAIDSSSKDMIILLGEAGSGKSVALRRFVTNGTTDAIEIKYFPVYINLRSWQLSSNEIPTIDGFTKFVCNYITLITGGKSYYSDIFLKLLEEKKCFFLFDSFDEIPFLLNEPAYTKLPEKTSEVILAFSQLHSYRTIVASRYFKRPSSPSLNTRNVEIFEIRPFTDLMLVELLKKNGVNGRRGKDFLKQLFLERSELIQVIKNPLMSMLFIKYINDNGLVIPPSTTEMFSSFFKKILNHHAFKKDEIADFCHKVAKEVFSGIGYEVPLHCLDLDESNFVISYLLDRRIIRKMNNGTISFTHRRFAEYFAVKLIGNNSLELKYSDISEDGSTRDTLVLYSNIADNYQAHRLIEYCIEILNKRGVIK